MGMNEIDLLASVENQVTTDHARRALDITKQSAQPLFVGRRQVQMAVKEFHARSSVVFDTDHFPNPRGFLVNFGTSLAERDEITYPALIVGGRLDSVANT